jgi:hypothetical protein
MHIAALLFATAVAQTQPDAIIQDGFDAGASCPATILSSTGPLTLRRRSDVLYLPGTAHVRHDVDVTQWDNIWGHINEVDNLVLWPGAPGASPTVKTIGKTEYLAAKFHVPIDALPTLSGTFKHVSYGGGPNVDVTISRTCGDFETIQQGCWVSDLPANDAPGIRWRVSSSNRMYCHLDPGSDYFLNVRFTDPHTTGPDCQGLSCQMTLQQYIGNF